MPSQTSRNHRTALIEMPVTQNIPVTDLIGKGRDGLIYSLLKEESNTGWYGWVVKIPRFRIKSLPQPYGKAVYTSIGYQNRTVKVAEIMVANFNAEKRLQKMLWHHLSTSYISSIGLPDELTWTPRNHILPEVLHLQGVFDDEGNDEDLDDFIKLHHCLVMPFAIMDGFQALVHHYSDALNINFLSDILAQLEFLEDKNIAHGDFKLSNILLFNWGHHGYIFVLADFWDAFCCDESGQVLELYNDNPMRRLQRWKFQTEKFGTRLYKDPGLLTNLRACRADKFRSLTPVHAGKINLWSFGIIMALMMVPKSSNENIKNKIKVEVMHSGRQNPEKQSLGPHAAVAKLRNLLIPYLESDSRPRGRTAHRPNQAHEPIFNRLKSVLSKHVLVNEEDRWTVRQVREYLAVPALSQRNVRQDLGLCKRVNDCSLCKSKASRERR